MEIETWWLYRDDNGKFIKKLGLRDDTDLDYYIDNPFSAQLDGGWMVVSYNE